jgi:CheY-like chemotaxis protein
MSRERVALIIEDLRANAQVIIQLLESINIKHKLAENIETANKLIKLHSFDLVIADMDLPDGRGTESIELFREYFSKIPVYVVSGKISKEDLVKLHKLTITEIFTKPFDINKLKTSILKNLLSKNDIAYNRKVSRDILVVDDEKSNRLLYKSSVESLGYTTDEAEDGKEALDKIENNKYKLILLDLTLPNIHGLDILEKIKDLEKKVIVITASRDIQTVMTAKKSKVLVDYLIKPIDIHKLTEKVKNFI